jgi:deoxyribonuclease V
MGPRQTSAPPIPAFRPADALLEAFAPGADLGVVPLARGHFLRSSDPVILAVDVHYLDEEDTASAGGVLAAHWPDESVWDRITYRHQGLEDYVPGQFYKRELPCLLPLVRLAEQRQPLSVIVVDGFVDLGEKPGLGRHLYDALGQAYPVIGVAKSEFPGADALAVRRGSSAKPLWVSATGDTEEAARHVLSMAGTGRFPKLLREADRLAREG